MAKPEDLAVLWAFFGGLRCVLTPVEAGWQIRIEDGRETVKSYVAGTSDEALSIRGPVADRLRRRNPSRKLRHAPMARRFTERRVVGRRAERHTAIA